MDATTILAVISCAIVLTGWLLLPHQQVAEAEPVVEIEERVPVSAA